MPEAYPLKGCSLEEPEGMFRRKVTSNDQSDVLTLEKDDSASRTGNKNGDDQAKWKSVLYTFSQESTFHGINKITEETSFTCRRYDFFHSQARSCWVGRQDSDWKCRSPNSSWKRQRRTKGNCIQMEKELTKMHFCGVLREKFKQNFNQLRTPHLFWIAQIKNISKRQQDLIICWAFCWNASKRSECTGDL